MKTSDVIKHFGTQVATAKALGMHQSSVSTWGEYPPPLRQLQIERLTGGALTIEAECLDPKAASAGSASVDAMSSASTGD